MLFVSVSSALLEYRTNVETEVSVLYLLCRTKDEWFARFFPRAACVDWRLIPPNKSLSNYPQRQCPVVDATSSSSSCVGG